MNACVYEYVLVSAAFPKNCSDWILHARNIVWNRVPSFRYLGCELQCAVPYMTGYTTPHRL